MWTLVGLTSKSAILSFSSSRFGLWRKQVALTPNARLGETIDPDDSVKVAFLSSWNGFDASGTAAAQSYAAGKTFQVVDSPTDRVVKTGVTGLSATADAPTNFWLDFARTAVRKMDFSDVTAPGTYHVMVDGVGRSHDFAIGDSHWDNLFKLSFLGFYHQRSGIALTEEFTAWTRDRSLHPDDGTIVYQTTLNINDTRYGRTRTARATPLPCFHRT